MGKYLCEEDMSTGEYISREDVLEKAKSSISVPADNEWDCGYNTAMAEMQVFIKQLPSTDVQSVRHGRWKLTDNPSFKKCSECDAWWSSVFTDSCLIKYCPNCGARIIKDGDAE